MSGPKTLTAFVLLIVAAAPVCAADHELKTLEVVANVAAAFGVRAETIPAGLLCEAKGVAIIPNVVKAGVLLDGRFGRGVLLIHQPDGSWSQPIFITLRGIGVGVEAGVEASDVVLVFKTDASLERILKGNGQLKLGTDATVAVGPLGKEMEKTAETRRNAQVYCYSHSKGLFAGLALEGDKLRVDTDANEAFYHMHGGHAADVMAVKGPSSVVVVEQVRQHLARMCAPPPAGR